jgi:type IV pilus assembly protein PilA
MKICKAFSLIELMIVVAIIGIIAMLAAPSITRYIARAKRAEAMIQLKTIYAAEKAYWAENGHYTNRLTGDKSIGWTTESSSGKPTLYYTYGFPGAAGVQNVPGKLGTSSTYLSVAFANDSGFKAVAAGDIDGDGIPDIIAIDQDGEITIVQDDLA